MEFLAQAAEYFRRAADTPELRFALEEEALGELPWGVLDRDIRLHLCWLAGLPASVAQLPASAIARGDRDMILWAFQARTRFKVTF